ncbi:DUF1178 family protein [Sneathiella limimaris]|uniref:DUF1178 family protein n=1 Tax=Sneathiella limimaris TaxID=1964213 RepID=UPI00146A5455|nr:DUF1178 family protein [Sneathiella limimaris]
MIKYNLKCNQNHVFEAWFKNSSAYDEQVERGLIPCTLCGSTQVEKALMAPSIGKKSNSKEAETAVQVNDSPEVQMAMKALQELRKNVEENCDYVGNRFAEEARKIHYGETEKRGIYGEATKDEQAELAEEGVEVAAIPWLPNTDA